MQITQEQLNSWYTHESNKERTIRMQEIDQEEDDDVCTECLGDRYITIQTGPDDDYTRPCGMCNMKGEDDYDNRQEIENAAMARDTH